MVTPAPSWPDYLDVFRSLGIEPEMTVVDLCGGDGGLATTLARLVEGKLHVFDIDPVVLKRTRAETTRHNVSVRGLIWDDIENLPHVLPELADYVLMANTLHSLSDKTGIAKSVHAALKPNGKFGIIDWRKMPYDELVRYNQPPGPANRRRLSPDDIRAAIEPAGFALDASVKLPPQHMGVVFNKTAEGD